jgi:hypothetical protein
MAVFGDPGSVLDVVPSVGDHGVIALGAGILKRDERLRSHLGLLPELDTGVVVFSNSGRSVDAGGMRLLMGMEEALRQ